ncbi:hypothetical protein DPMN_026261 [Dreissena polymorpha]|uniref:Uncharacterized protein n=1 Tax=Dreissena polymorpha TaxID=45954 RepID=A0A9D4RED8_DREPO|nr:hypothetical protein DPMN_026261 [Dreissena polymorpha]
MKSESYRNSITTDIEDLLLKSQLEAIRPKTFFSDKAITTIGTCPNHVRNRQMSAEMRGS